MADDESVAFALRQVRLMERFFAEVVDAKPETRAFLAELHTAYMDLLNESLAPYALDIALALLEREAPALPARRKKRPRN